LAGIVVQDGPSGAAWSVASASQHPPLDAAMQVVIDLRAAARQARDFATADRIRAALAPVGIAIADAASGATWGRRI
jgi:cysteinyl-tRNA synthetase